MAVLEKIRVKFGLAISIIIALALLSFIIDPSTLESAMNSMSSKYDVGQIAGKSISYSDFQSDVDRFTTINELLGAGRDEESQKQIRNAAWQELIDKYLFVKNAKEAGITVGEDEMLSLMSGEYVSPALAQNPVFMDENGTFSPDRLKAFLQNVDADDSGQFRTYWNYVQNTVHNQQYYAKYGALFTASGSENALQLAQAVQEGNTTADVDYCMVFYPMSQNDSTITVSDDEVRAYYKAHKDFFKQKANREIEYVVFEVIPSSDDIAAASSAMDEAFDEFATTDNMRAFLLKNSDRGLDNYWYKAGELATVNAELDEQIFGGNKLTQIITDGNSFFAGREMASKMMPDSAFVKHILLQGENAAQVADSLVNVLKKGGNFANLAAAYSADQGSAADGELGSIGWMTQTYMVPGFEDVFDAKVGVPYVLTTQYGTHVVLVSDKTKPVAKKQVAILEKTALASKETFNNYYSQANTFATLAGGTYEGYKKALDSTKVYSHPATITEATAAYGAIDNAKEVTRWAFDNKPGKASNIITVDNNYFFVAALKEANKEGYASVQKVASQIYDLLYSQKVQEAARQEIAEKIAGASSIDEVAERLGVTVEHRDALSLGSSSVEPALIGAIASAKEGELYGPVSGVMGTYVIRVANKERGSFYSEADAKNLALQKAQYLSQMIIPVMQEYDNVKDNRERFF
ncbi:MAG: SurA N-terminal domain-containing protein [Bacteroidales bacterium]|nr:SurA N-terminal domain-containing protein [Bacteroidales bacterium]MDY6444056.1 SurA N-terminal domain-containing protein [Bacteroidales bacterium]